MVGRRVLNEAMSKMVNAERRRVAMVKLQPMSFIIAEFLKIMKYRGYIKDYKIYDPHYVGRIEVELSGRIKDCRTLMYRQDYEASQLPQFLRRFLPTQQKSKSESRLRLDCDEISSVLRLDYGAQFGREFAY